jgi:hypothetical protein
MWGQINEKCFFYPSFEGKFFYLFTGTHQAINGPTSISLGRPGICGGKNLAGLGKILAATARFFPKGATVVFWPFGGGRSRGTGGGTRSSIHTGKHLKSKNNGIKGKPE